MEISFLQKYIQWTHYILNSPCYHLGQQMSLYPEVKHEQSTILNELLPVTGVAT